MKTDYAGVIKKSLKFAFKPKHWLPFFAVNATFFLIIVGILYQNIDAFSMLQTLTQENISSNYEAMLQFLQLMFVFLFITILWQLAKLFVTGAVTYQSYKEKEYAKSWRIAAQKYLTLLFASILVIATVSIFSLVPYIGELLAIIITIVFWFFIPAIILGNLGTFDSLKKSYNILKKEPPTVFFMWLSVVIINILIIIVFALPIALLFVRSYLPHLINSAGSDTTSIISVLTLMKSNFQSLIVFSVIYLIGASISQTFSVKAVTEYYQKFKRKRFGII